MKPLGRIVFLLVVKLFIHNSALNRAQPASASLRKMKEEEKTNKDIKNLLRFINKSLAKTLFNLGIFSVKSTKVLIDLITCPLSVHLMRV